MSTGQMHLSTELATVYHFQKDGEWASFAITHHKNARNHGPIRGGVVHGGMVMINSSFGSFSNEWSDCAMDFRLFVAKMSLHTLGMKTRGDKAYVLDEKGTEVALRTAIEDMRRELDAGEIDEDRSEMEEDLNELAMIADELGSMGNESDFRMRLLMVDYNHPDYFEQIAESVVRQKIDPQIEGLWTTFWPSLAEQLKAEVDAEAAMQVAAAHPQETADALEEQQDADRPAKRRRTNR